MFCDGGNELSSLLQQKISCGKWCHFTIESSSLHQVRRQWSSPSLHVNRYKYDFRHRNAVKTSVQFHLTTSQGSCLSLRVLGPVELIYRQEASYLPPSLKLAFGRCCLVDVPTRDDTAHRLTFDKYGDAKQQRPNSIRHVARVLREVSRHHTDRNARLCSNTIEAVSGVCRRRTK
jgi:hypothetical protein